MNTLAVSEIFRSFQGEGPSAGRLASFVRLGGCNLHCSWCDTPYTWDGQNYDLRKEIQSMPVDDVLAALASHRTNLVVITGGEPLLQQGSEGWRELAANLDGWTAVEVETNGTIAPVYDYDHFRYVVSPKLSHAGNGDAARNDAALRVFADSYHWTVFKFVVRQPADLDEVQAIADRYDIGPSRIWIMPEGIGATRIMLRARELADHVLERGWNMTLRQHIELWGGARGR